MTQKLGDIMENIYRTRNESQEYNGTSWARHLVNFFGLSLKLPGKIEMIKSLETREASMREIKSQNYEIYTGEA